MAQPKGRAPVAGAAAFTLLEVILSAALVVLLAGVAVAVFRGALRQARTQANANRITSLLRSARAEAANTGRRCRLQFDKETFQPIVSVENDPLGEPGAFTACSAWWLEQARLQEGVRVLLCERTDEDLPADTGESVLESDQDRDETLGELDFYPDGSSDSARIVLANDDDEHPWAVEITLNGVDGTIATREIDLEEEPVE